MRVALEYDCDELINPGENPEAQIPPTPDLTQIGAELETTVEWELVGYQWADIYTMTERQLEWAQLLIATPWHRLTVLPG